MLDLNQPLIINFKSYRELEEIACKSIIRTINEAFNAAKGNYEQMQCLNDFARELVFHTDVELDKISHGPLPKKEEMTKPEVA